MPKNPMLYLESTIPSYPTACPSRDLIVAEQAGEEHWTGGFIFGRVSLKEELGAILIAKVRE